MIPRAPPVAETSSPLPSTQHTAECRQGPCQPAPAPTHRLVLGRELCQHQASGQLSLHLPGSTPALTLGLPGASPLQVPW